ncbi:terpene synthase family protein [Streptomyces sp. ET3-23]|uniref:terpene synthase family protein n=1 Tax=Streptomyces sp. ET3-23 TaxID=2885643 RepID=UPI001D12266B|nr:terpene synthase family protein [Streptomyces sp. ET3-23]MCC2280753.1 terpene synthase family protein [Streptomyces sp. ET3-23]
MTPDAKADLVQLGADWAYLLFAVDDTAGTDLMPSSTGTAQLTAWFHELFLAAAHPTAAESQPNDPRNEGNAFLQAASHLSLRVRQSVPRHLWHRWVRLHYPIMWGAAWESAHRDHQRRASFNSYLGARPGLGAAEGTILMGEIAAELDVPEREREHPLVRAVIDIAALVICLDDDIYSWPRERHIAERVGRDPADDTSAIPILAREHHLSIEDAVDLTVSIRDRLVRRFEVLAAQITPGRFTPATVSLAEITANLIVTGIIWAEGSPRYTDPDGSAPGSVPLKWEGRHTQAPTDTPLPYPVTTAWWQRTSTPERHAAGQQHGRRDDATSAECRQTVE